jgi:hypothetical protein
MAPPRSQVRFLRSGRLRRQALTATSQGPDIPRLCPVPDFLRARTKRARHHVAGAPSCDSTPTRRGRAPGSWYHDGVHEAVARPLLVRTRQHHQTHFGILVASWFGQLDHGAIQKGAVVLRAVGAGDAVPELAPTASPVWPASPARGDSRSRACGWERPPHKSPTPPPKSWVIRWGVRPHSQVPAPLPGVAGGRRASGPRVDRVQQPPGSGGGARRECHGLDRRHPAPIMGTGDALQLATPPALVSSRKVPEGRYPGMGNVRALAAAAR